MKTLNDIPVTGIDILQKLASMGVVNDPPGPQNSAGAPSPPPKDKGYQRPGSGGGLGALDVGRYLTHYGVEYDAKVEGNRALYRLNHCLFNIEHGRNEAAIVQDITGRITYTCFHQSCNHTWSEARALISGDEKIAQFCEGYDPNYHSDSPRQRRSERPPEPPSPFDSGRDNGPVPAPEEDESASVPEPHDITPLVFFENKRFMPQFLAKYLEKYMSPVKYDGGNFYKYMACGYWKKLPADKISQVAEIAMDKHATSAKISDAVTLLGHRVFIQPEDFRHNPDYINLRSGMLDIDTLEIVPHHPKYYSRFQLPVQYSLDSDPPRAIRWEQFLTEIFPGEDGAKKAQCLQSFFGYCLLPDCRYQKCLFLIGSGANGKSVVIDILVDLVGQENVSSLPLQLFGQRFLIGQLKDKLVNVAGEISTQGPIDTDVFKNAVSGGLLMADEKHGKPFGFYPHAKHIFAMNEVPKINDKSHGFTRRPIVLKFTEQFDGDRKDPNLLKKLRTELDGIFFWMLEGLNMILHYGDLFVPDVVEEDGAEFIKTTNPVLTFFDECCILGDGKMVAPQKLFEKYLSWCTEGKNRPMSRNRFYAQVLLHCKTVRKAQVGPERQRVFTGIGLQGVY